ncbi:replication initiation protein [Lactobacillus crispatus]|jgi:hypothetical protein|uniref:Replication initiation protein n=1 Tax=Lactobacillus crispatus TaxID=47770 RepID=A0AAW8WV41_9LACO|nr:replication initiation protein [Lactobacillus crispatus]STX18341.1 Protein involved in initiation of plasmid replication [Lactobacillus acidophilus]MCT7698222.1 replication initiation protein [Lactobacillus crispatus]MCT7709700.1 replication initiation protein [Lactobacillus crispatus]MCT7730907.1 replication initiation protein [Lactobacillus crispatus]MCT7803297.1 replication initiation protein [Lactobacillus crispatus]
MKNQKENNCLSLLNKLMSKKVAVRNTDGSTKEHQLFKNAAYNSNTGEVKIELDSGVKKVLFDDMPSPDITMKLNHRYSMPLAILLSEKKQEGIALYDRKKLCMFLHTPESYYNRNAYIMTKVLSPSIKELNEAGLFKNLKVESIRKNNNYKNSPVIGYKFTFTPVKESK